MLVAYELNVTGPYLDFRLSDPRKINFATDIHLIKLIISEC